MSEFFTMNNKLHPPFSALILAGGRGTRMEGLDKGLVLWQGEPLIAYVLSSIHVQVDDIVISCNRSFEDYQHYGTVVADNSPDFLGPLSGIAAALPHCQHEWAFVVACDMPCLPADIVLRLWQALHDNAQLAVGHDGEHLQPLCLLLNKSLWPSLDEYVKQGHASVYKWINTQVHSLAYVNDKHAFMNINSLAELG